MDKSAIVLKDFTTPLPVIVAKLIKYEQVKITVAKLIKYEPKKKKSNPSITLISKPDKDTARKLCLMETVAKIRNKVSANQLDNMLKGSYATVKWDSIPGCKDGLTSANQPTWYTTLIKQRIKIRRLSQ